MTTPYPGGGSSPSNPDGGDPPAPLDDIAELGRGIPRIGTPVHVVTAGNPSGAPCVPAFYLGYDGRDAHIWMCFAARSTTAVHEQPGLGQGPAFTYGTFHVAARCEVRGPVVPAEQVAMPEGHTISTDDFRDGRI